MAQDASKGRLGLTRRLFLAGAAGAGFAGGTIALEAIAAERMPHRMIVRGIPSSPFFELREYEAVTPELTAILEHHGIRPVWAEKEKLLIAFESLSARETAWRGVSADRDWMALGASVQRIAIYRTL